jgi:hypothetical protein
MTAAVLALLDSSHATGVLPDGDDWRPCCVCGWTAKVTELTEAAARAVPCGVEREQIEGRARLAAYMARQQRERVA